MAERILWSEREVELLIQLIRDHDILTALDGKRYRNGDIYKTLVPLFVEHGFSRTGDQLRTKWKALQVAYRKAKGINNKSGSGTAKCPYYEELDQILGHRPNASLVSQGFEAAVPFNEDTFQFPEGVEELTISVSPYFVAGDSSSSSSPRPSTSSSGSLAVSPPRVVAANTLAMSTLPSDCPPVTPGPSALRGTKRRASYTGSLAKISEQLTRTQEVVGKVSGDYINTMKEEFAKQRKFEAKQAKRAHLAQAKLLQGMMGHMFASMGMMRQVPMPQLAAPDESGSSSEDDL